MCSIKFSVTNFIEVSPVVENSIGWVLELFHGPTFAFKDIALQFLGNLFEYFLSVGSRKQKKMTILVATSGDTGSAAIHGMSGKKNIDTFVMFPQGKVSLVQELQMTTVIDRHVHCISLQGDFDDAQSLVKAAFSDSDFRESVNLGAVNSINIARIIAQISYYFYSWLAVTDAMIEKDQEPIALSYAVPTGNFGDILAGYYAKRMGLPIDKLIICANKNDVLHRFLQTGVYQRQTTSESLAPSMDISVSSNFERYLYHLCGDDSAMLRQWMQQFETTGTLQVPEDLLRQAQSDFLSYSCDDGQILSTIQEVYQATQYLICPHTATAFAAAKNLQLPTHSTVLLATAHPMKFEDTVRRALSVSQIYDIALISPPELSALHSMSRRSILLPNDVEVIKSFVRYNVNNDNI